MPHGREVDRRRTNKVTDCNKGEGEGVPHGREVDRRRTNKVTDCNKGEGEGCLTGGK